jgi:hypothetical protein
MSEIAIFEQKSVSKSEVMLLTPEVPFQIKVNRSAGEGGVYMGHNSSPISEIKIIPIAFQISERVNIFNENFNDSIFCDLLCFTESGVLSEIFLPTKHENGNVTINALNDFILQIVASGNEKIRMSYSDMNICSDIVKGQHTFFLNHYVKVGVSEPIVSKAKASMKYRTVRFEVAELIPEAKLAAIMQFLTTADITNYFSLQKKAIPATK